jgi:hypothetical protein
MYLRATVEKELVAPSTLDTSPAADAAKTVIEVHHEQEMYARWCARRTYDRIWRMADKNPKPLDFAVKLVMEPGYLEGEFRKYEVTQDHIKLSVSLVTEMMLADLKADLNRRKGK